MPASFFKSPRAQLLASLAGAFILGTAGAYAMAPYYFWFLLFLSLSGFYFLLTHSRSPWQALAIGWLFGLGYHLFGLSWIGNAFKVEGNPFSWVYPLAVAGLPMLLACFPALAGFILRRFYNLRSLAGFCVFLGLMGLAETLRGFIFSGFPWNLYGHSWGEMLPLIQITAYSDVYFLTLLTVFWMSVPGFLFVYAAPHKYKTAVVLVAALSFALCHGLGSMRLNQNPTSFHDDVSVRIVQPNILQADKWKREKMVANFYRHVDLSAAEGDSAGTTYIVWPETALNRWFAGDRSSMQALGEALKSYEGTAALMTGILRYNAENKTYFNSLVLIDEHGNFVETYDKSHLVPFGEYIPLQEWIPLEPVVQFSGFAAGDGPEHFTTAKGLTYSPLICYEIVFSGHVVEKGGERPDFIVNVTNDAWYGRSSGPYQHFGQAVFRAVEEGVPVVRSANTGISGVIDPYGRILYQTELFEEQAKTLHLPKKIATSEKSFYFKALILWGALLSLLAVGTIRK